MPLTLPIGWNFYGTVAYRSDHAPNIAVTSGTLYSAGQGYGWLTSAGHHANRNASVDARLGGINYEFNSGTVPLRWQMDIAAGTSISITMAIGDYTAGHPNEVKIHDDVTEIAYIQGSTSAQQWIDATGVLRTSAADWISNNAKLAHTMVSSVLYMELAAVASSDVTTIAHLRIEEAAGGVAVPHGALMMVV